MLKNLSIAELKESEGINVIDIVKNPKTEKLFASADNGKNYRVQQDIDVDKRIAFLYDDETELEEGQTLLETGCVVNSNDENVLKTL